jgi:N-acetylneuraminic acid mutarotase
VFICGGGGEGCNRPDYSNSSSCEFYTPEDNTFAASKAKLRTGRIAFTASLMRNGKVLVCGGYNGFFDLRTTEIYDPVTDSFSNGPQMVNKRSGHTATVLADGRILITGGDCGARSHSTEIYDPETNSFSMGQTMGAAGYSHYSALLPDGKVFFGGGFTFDHKQAVEIYDPVEFSFSTEFDLLQVRDYASAALF